MSSLCPPLSGNYFKGWFPRGRATPTAIAIKRPDCRHLLFDASSGKYAGRARNRRTGAPVLVKRSRRLGVHDIMPSITANRRSRSILKLSSVSDGPYPRGARKGSLPPTTPRPRLHHLGWFGSVSASSIPEGNQSPHPTSPQPGGSLQATLPGLNAVGSDFSRPRGWTGSHVPGRTLKAYSHVPGSASHRVRERGRPRGEGRHSQARKRKMSLALPSKFGGGGCGSLKGERRRQRSGANTSIFSNKIRDTKTSSLIQPVFLAIHGDTRR